MATTSPPTRDRNAAADNEGWGWPRRWHYACAGGFFLALAVYGSLVPLEYESLEWAVAVDRFTRLFTEGTAAFSRTDVVVNVLLFVPVSFCFLAALTTASCRLPGLMARAAIVMVLCVVASFSIEFSQMWFVRRTASAYDVYAQIVGTLLGLVGWIFVGRAFSDWLRTRSATHARLVSLSGVLAAYYACLIFYWMLPLDLTMRPAELLHKYREGRVGLRPFAEVVSLAAVVDIISHLAAFVPVGMLAVVLFTSQRRPVRSWLGSLLFAALLVSLVWFAGLLAVSRYSSSTQWIVGLVGAGLGVVWARRWLAGSELSAEAATETGQRDRFWLYVVLALAYVGLLVLLFCYPEGPNARPISNSGLLQERFHSMFRPPLASLYKGSIFNAVKELIRKVGLFAPLGYLLYAAIHALQLPRSLSSMLAVGAGLFCLGLGLAIELVQVVVPGHTPDLTDAFLCAAGGALGIVVAAYWKGFVRGAKRN